ncbi:DNA polymerase V, subunit C [Serratia sp. FS14]|nr:DNA polymerase V, subunit C [Serratia sp. FS14]
MIARSAEAKALGVPMGAPYFKIKEEMRRRNVAVFSSNYALYADMSRRVMDTLEEMAPAVEIYSLDKSKLYSVVTQTVESELWTFLNV